MPRLLFNPFSGTFDYVNRPDEKQHVGEVLTGAVDGTNVVFRTLKIFSTRGACSIAVYLNGVRLLEGISSDYVIAESGVPGSGYDTVILAIAPRTQPHPDQLTADYTEI